jgi:hypothetical protein
MVNVTANTNPWIETMKPYMTRILDSNVLGAKTLALLSAAQEQLTAVLSVGNSTFVRSTYSRYSLLHRHTHNTIRRVARTPRHHQDI